MEYKIVEFEDYFIIAYKKQGDTESKVYTAKNHGELFAWLRLMLGAYDYKGEAA